MPYSGLFRRFSGSGEKHATTLPIMSQRQFQRKALMRAKSIDAAPCPTIVSRKDFYVTPPACCLKSACHECIQRDLCPASGERKPSIVEPGSDDLGKSRSRRKVHVSRLLQNERRSNTSDGRDLE